MNTRNCEVCGADCRRKKVQSQEGKRVICLACGAKGYRFREGKLGVVAVRLIRMITTEVPA